MRASTNNSKTILHQALCSSWHSCHGSSTSSRTRTTAPTNATELAENDIAILAPKQGTVIVEVRHRERIAGATEAAGTAAAVVTEAVKASATVAVLATDPEKAAVAAKVLATDQEQNQ
jgi:hypothetical protein